METGRTGKGLLWQCLLAEAGEGESRGAPSLCIAMWQGQGREEGALGILCFFSAHRNCTPDFGCPFWLLRAAGDLANRGVGGEAVNPNATE